jgi:ABC-type Fe3+-hydroxamate transport system substrate-binding protein
MNVDRRGVARSRLGAIIAVAGLLASACTPAGGPTASPVPPTTSLPPSPQPTPEPTAVPTDAPTSTPSPEPTIAPTASPSPEPTSSPSPAAVAYPVEITDANGNIHTIDAPVTRFGSMWDGAVLALADLGLPVHAESYGNDPASVFYYPNGAPAEQGLEYDVEKWAASEVELILTAAPGFAGFDDVVEDALQNVVYLHFPPRDTTSPPGADAWIENLRLVAMMADRLSEADAAVARYEQVVAALTERAPADAADIDVMQQIVTDDGSYVILPAGTPFCETLEEHGWGRCAVPEELRGQTEQNVLEVNAEAVLELDPDWISYVVFDPSQTFASRDDAVWQDLGAVAADQVYDTGNGYNCCMLRHLEWALQHYAHHVWGEEAGVPDPGPILEFDPWQSALLET